MNSIHNHYYNNQTQPKNLKYLRQSNYWRILNKNAEKYTKIWAPKNMYRNIGVQ
jgi:hypothetical protein